MQVEFQKTGKRRYGVIIKRENLPDLVMNPAPGFDPLMPHDLLHFLVEQELGLKKGIYGQIASGGTAGTFHTKTSEKSNDRIDSRLRRKTAKRGEKLLKTGLDDCAQSERATFISLYEWFAQSSNAVLKTRAVEMKQNAESVLAQMSEAERKALKEKLPAITNKMEELSHQWSALKINESLRLEWL